MNIYRYIFISAWAAITQYHQLDGLNNRIYFLTVLEAGNLRSGCQHDWFLVRALFLTSCRWLPPRCVLTQQRECELSGVSYKDTNPNELWPNPYDHI